MAEAEDAAARAADPEYAQPEARSDDEGEELGRLGRILAIPLVPFVALWEALNAGARGVSSGARCLASAGASVGRFVGRIVSAAARSVVLSFRAGYSVVVRFGRWARTALAWGWGSVLAAASPIARLVAVGARAIVRPVRVLWQGLVYMARRVGVVLRGAARILAVPVRAFARAVGAAARRVMAAARRLGETVRSLAQRVAGAARMLRNAVVRLGRVLVAPALAAGRWILRGIGAMWTTFVSFGITAARAIGGALRPVLRAAQWTTRALSEGIRAIARAAVGPFKSLVDVILAGARGIVRLLSVIGRNAVSATRAVGRHLRRAGLTVARLVAAPLVVAALAVRAGARLIAAGATLMATSLVRFVRWIWRPAAGVGRQAREWSRPAIESLRKAGRMVGAHLRSTVANAGSKARAQWRRSRESAQRVRTTTRQALKNARLGARRWARAIGRSNTARSRRSATELPASPADDEISGTLEGRSPADEAPALRP